MHHAHIQVIFFFPTTCIKLIRLKVVLTSLRFFLLLLFFYLTPQITPKNGRYQIDSDVLLFPWKLTYRNIGSDFIPRGAFGKVYLAQDRETKKRMACKLVSSVVLSLSKYCTTQYIWYIFKYVCIKFCC